MLVLTANLGSKMNHLFRITTTSICLSLLFGCGAAGHRNAVRDDTKDRISVGKVQKEIKVGMSSADVVSVLGSPNIVTTDSQRREEWVYDKISTESVYSTSEGGIGALILGFAGNVAGGAGPGYGRKSGASSTNQRTLTIIVKFDEYAKVRDFAYHNSSF